MTTIDESWRDGFLYFVEFQVIQQGVCKTFKRSLIIYEELDQKDMKKLLLTKFPKVDCIKNIEYFEEVLLLI